MNEGAAPWLLIWKAFHVQTCRINEIYHEVYAVWTPEWNPLGIP